MTLMTGLDYLNLVSKYSDSQQNIKCYISSSNSENLKELKTMKYKLLSKPFCKSEILKIIKVKLILDSKIIKHTYYIRINIEFYYF